jgi:hypothetical protein
MEPSSLIEDEEARQLQLNIHELAAMHNPPHMNFLAILSHGPQRM